MAQHPLCYNTKLIFNALRAENTLKPRQKIFQNLFNLPWDPEVQQ